LVQTADKGSYPIMGENELSEFVMHFYEKPEPDKLVSAIFSLSHYKDLDKDVIELSNIISMFAAALNLHPDQLESYIELAMQLSDNHRLIVWQSLWLSNLLQAHSFLKARMRIGDSMEQSVIKMMFDRQAVDLKQAIVAGPASLDLLWGAFFASGDAEYVKKIVEVLSWPEDDVDLNKIMVKGMARWSIISIAKRHKLVLETCKKVQQSINTQENELNRIYHHELEQIIKTIEKD